MVRKKMEEKREKKNSEEKEASEYKESQQKKSIKICFWNVGGCSNKGPEFWDYIDKFDIVALQETHITSVDMEFINSLRQTFRWKYQYATKTSKEGSESGGILTGIKCHIAENKVDIEEVDGIQERRPIIGKDELRILAVYTQDVKRTKKHLEEMVRFTESRKVLIGGDFNARTEREGTIIYGPAESAQPRKSQNNSKPSPSEKILLRMVNENGWSIMNGNRGDEGEFTNKMPKGISVIDYVIANVQARDKVTNFKVDCEGFEAGHRPVIIEIEMEEESELQKIKNEDQVWEYINAEKKTGVQRVEENFTRGVTEIVVKEMENRMAILNIEETVDINIKEIINNIRREIGLSENWTEPNDTNENGNVTLKKDIIPETQAELKSANGALDNVFILNSIIKTELKEKNGKVYAFFVKLAEAFDRVDKEELERTMEANGISETLRTTIKEMHRETKGLRRVCPLSPILFSLYIADLEGEMRKANIEDLQNGKIKLRSFVNKDNIVLIAKKSEGLRKLMEDLKNYLDRKKLEINLEKSKVLVFTKSCFEKEQWKWGEKVIDQVKSYEYLKIHFQKDGTLKYSEDTVNRAMVAMAYTWHIGKRKWGNNIKERLMMFKVLIGNILLYGAEIWDAMEMREIEIVEAKYLRMLLEEVIGESIESISTEARKIADDCKERMKGWGSYNTFKEYLKLVEETGKESKKESKDEEDEEDEETYKKNVNIK